MLEPPANQLIALTTALEAAGIALAVGSIAHKKPELMRSLVPKPDARSKAA